MFTFNFRDKVGLHLESVQQNCFATSWIHYRLGVIDATTTTIIGESIAGPSVIFTAQSGGDTWNTDPHHQPLYSQGGQTPQGMGANCPERRATKKLHWTGFEDAGAQRSTLVASLSLMLKVLYIYDSRNSLLPSSCLEVLYRGFETPRAACSLREPDLVSFPS